jgi:hypothetical protein
MTRACCYALYEMPNTDAKIIYRNKAKAPIGAFIVKALPQSAQRIL